MRIFFQNIIKYITFFFIKILRSATLKFDKKISLNLSKLNWSSEIYSKGLEVTTTVGCAMMCEYCPQDNYKKSGVNFPRALSFDLFKKAIENVDASVKIHWTGFSEPLHCKEFPEMSDYANKKGHKQHISTTLFGRENSKNFLINEGVFDTVVLHLPDNQNLMKLKVNEDYVAYLEKVVRNFSKKIHKKKFQIMVIGENFQKDIKLKIDNLLSQNVISKSNLYIRRHLVTRAGQVEEKKGFQRNTLKYSYDNQSKNDLYYCSYGRLNKSVMLTNGDLALCCNDYSIEHNVGSLIQNNLSELYKHQKLFSDDTFIKGEMPLCKRCEFYQKL